MAGQKMLRHPEHWGGTVNNYQSSTGKLAAQEEFLG
jgi:hypothetical protein